VSGSIGVVAPSAERTRSSTASPLPSSSITSRITSAGRRTSIARSASATPPAVTTSKPSAARLSARKAAVAASSSTSKTLSMTA
jgi:hypothetical protein